ncbi:hypothetical protein K523DRAFT_234840 [Schizophyllum commune Tattone D]|nr:hypothetical protein K523DRAFT_234840 [Schizophyllum commune Tattone D]
MPRVVDYTEYPKYNTRAIRAKLGISLRTRRLEDKEIEVYRVLRLITTERLLPVHALTGEKFGRAWLQCTEVHYLNWMNGIRHQDPSLNNLMHRERDDGTVCAVLNDWDLALDAHEPRTHTGFETTGTIPFMAIDLLQPKALKGQVRHLYRHDLEAFVWILVWVVCCFHEGKRLAPLPNAFDRWTLGDPSQCLSSKRTILDDGWPGKEEGTPTANWVDREEVLAGTLLGWIHDLFGRKEAKKPPRTWIMSTKVDKEVDAPQPPELEPEEVWEEFQTAVKRAVRWADSDTLKYINDCFPSQR